MIKTIWAIIIAFLISACDIQENVSATPDRPKSVPTSAFWVGGYEGGVFVSLSKGIDSKQYNGTIYVDTSGYVIYEGKLKYTGDAELDMNDKSLYSGWDGESLLLLNGERLIAVDVN